MLRKILLKSLLCFGLLSLFFSSWVLWLNSSLLEKIKSIEPSQFHQEIENYRYPAIVSAPLKRLLNQSSIEPNVNNDSALVLLAQYLRYNSLDADAWLIGSQLYQRGQDLEKAALYLSVAHRLSETNTPILLKVFNRYLELNLIDEAMPVAHDIAIARPSEFRRLFFLMGRLSGDYSRVANTVIPKTVPTAVRARLNIPEDGSLYYSWALLDAIRAKNKVLANAVWKVVPPKYKLNTDLGINYLNFLVELQQLDLVKPVWNDVVGSPMLLAQALNQGGDEVSPCWRIRESGGVETSVSLGASGKALLELKFSGEVNVNFNHLSCLVLVEPGEQYKLTARSKGEGISTLSGPFFDVFFPSVNERHHQTEGLIGDWPWTALELVFDVPESAHFAQIRIRRNRTKLLDSKISGVVWFDSFELSKLNQLSNIRSNSL